MLVRCALVRLDFQHVCGDERCCVDGEVRTPRYFLFSVAPIGAGIFFSCLNCCSVCAGHTCCLTRTSTLLLASSLHPNLPNPHLLSCCSILVPCCVLLCCLCAFVQVLRPCTYASSIDINIDINIDIYGIGTTIPANKGAEAA